MHVGDGWLMAFGALFSVGVGVMVKAYLDIRKNKSEDAAAAHGRHQAELAAALAEYKVLLEAERKERREEEKALRADVNTLREQHVKCLVETEGLKGQLTLQESVLKRLQLATGDGPVHSLPAVMVATTTDGTIISVSPSVSALLHYLDSELIGQHVEVLLPERYRQTHRERLAEVEAGKTPWEDKAVVGFVLTREGYEVPVTITLSAWQDEAGRWVVSGEIVHRRHRPKATGMGKKEKPG
jgi:PAS domain S-box-containing protein